MTPPDATFDAWVAALIERHRADLQFAEVRRGLQALSAQYVQRRLTRGSAPLEGRGKRAAFALYYAPLHYAVVAGVCTELDLQPPRVVHDWGCGTGVGAAAWARTAPRATQLFGVDASRWALDEARWNWRALQLSGRTTVGDLARVRPPPAPPAPGETGIVLAFAANELPDGVRAHVLQVLRAAADAGCALLVIEPIARGIAPFWDDWRAALAPLGAEAHEHRFAAELPEALAAYGRAAKLDHRVLTARSLHLDPRKRAVVRGAGGHAAPPGGAPPHPRASGVHLELLARPW